MLFQLLERGEPVHSAAWFDTGWEFPAMHDHIALVRRMIAPVPVVELRPEISFWNRMMTQPIMRKKKTSSPPRSIGWGGRRLFAGGAQTKKRDASPGIPGPFLGPWTPSGSLPTKYTAAKRETCKNVETSDSRSSNGESPKPRPWPIAGRGASTGEGCTITFHESRAFAARSRAWPSCASCAGSTPICGQSCSNGTQKCPTTVGFTTMPPCATSKPALRRRTGKACSCRCGRAMRAGSKERCGMRNPSPCASCSHAVFGDGQCYGHCTLHTWGDGYKNPVVSKLWPCASGCEDYKPTKSAPGEASHA